MLLIGSRAIRHHIPEFREPVDWDLIGSGEELERIRPHLEPRSAHKETKRKAYFTYQGAFLEYLNTDEDSFWAEMCHVFRNDPTVSLPILGEVNLPPASFLMLTKYRALGFNIKHWHKNLAEMYQMQDYVQEIPERVAVLIPKMIAAAEEQYATGHSRVARLPVACHPKLPPHPRQDQHKLLHDLLKLGNQPMVEREGAWQAFPEIQEPEKTLAMQKVLAEEAMVLGGLHYLEVDRNRNSRAVEGLRNFALRTLITTGLPSPWRYFGVNHYREIMALIRDDYEERIGELDHLRPSSDNACDDELQLEHHMNVAADDDGAQH